MDQASTPAAQTQLSKKGAVAIAYHSSVQCYFRPETEELVFVADGEAGAFENHWRGMLVSMDAFHQAAERYSSALEAYGRAAPTGLSPLQQETHHKAVRAAEQALAENRKALHEKLGEFSMEGMSYDDVVELIPIAGRGGKGKKGGKSSRYAFVKKGYFSKTQQGLKLHSVSLKSSDGKGGAQSFISKDKHGRALIDTGKLAKQLSALEWPKLKLELKDVLKWANPDFDLKSLGIDEVLFDWAESWNHSLQGEKKDAIANVDFCAGAQFMRFVANMGASAEFDPHKSQASIKGEGKASLTLASGTVALTAYVPDRFGWNLKYTDSKQQLFDMGHFRLVVAQRLTGFIGASAMLEGQLQVMVKGDNQVLAGQKGGRLPRFKERRTRGAVFYQQMAREEEGLNLSAEGFAGVRAEAGLKGSLQWLKPAEPFDPDNMAAGLLKSTGEFTDFCSIASSISGMAGAGLGGKFYCTFINGRFCFHVAASLCWGVGAKGAVICEVGVSTIIEFGAWLIYQLYRLNYRFFDVVEEGAFSAYSQYCVMQMADAALTVYQSYGRLSGSAIEVSKKFRGVVDEFVVEGRNGLASSQKRNALASNTVSRRQELLRYTPEAKGILLYLLTRHGKWDHMDPENRSSAFLDVFTTRKEAVIWVLRSIQTRAEWRKVLCRLTVDGSNLAKNADEASVEKEQEQHLFNFLQLGFNRDGELHNAKYEMVSIRQRLKIEIAWGYALAMNDTWYYKINSMANPHYPQRCMFLPCDEDSNQLA
ncbi:hypothetical protein [Pseudomonas sp. NPDC087029]|uniref:hypothetical protein n=1 Tax=Pseudomonas sp. NPDC087029 TaxID=3364433 RepID=UPI0038205B1C